MRGKLSFSLLHDAFGRITPADAGKAVVALETMPLIVGSPPRMRGKRGGVRGGKGYTEDHPRGCGENLRLLCISVVFTRQALFALFIIPLNPTGEY